MSKKLHHVHDHFFKSAMSDVRVAKDFFEQYLPENIKQIINFNQLNLQKESYIDDDLKSAAADVVYKTAFQEQPGYLYVLVEHQSKVDRLMPFRIIKYMLKIMQQHLDQTRTTILPVVYPLVFYTGKSRYSGVIDFFKLFDVQEDLARQTFLQPLHLVDINQISDENLKMHLWSGILGFVYKHHALQLVQDFEKIVGLWLGELEKQSGFDYAVKILKYIFQTQKMNEPKHFTERLKPYLTESLGESSMQTVAEYLMEKGKKEGFQQGEYTLLLRLLKSKFQTIAPIYEQKLKQADADTLLRWGERILNAQTIQDIFDKD